MTYCKTQKDGASHRQAHWLGRIVEEVLELTNRRDAAETSTLVAGFVHAIRNPLFSVRLELHTLNRLAVRTGEAPPGVNELHSVAEQCDRHVDRVEQLLSDLMEYACPQPATSEAMDVRDELEAALECFQQGAAAMGLTVTFCPPAGPAWIAMDPSRFRYVVMCLLSNACRATDRNDLSVRGGVLNGAVEFWIENRHWELAPSGRRRIFEPFAKTPGIEPGLSLAVVRRNIELAHGSLACLAGHEGGAGFRVRLPLYAASYRGERGERHG